MFKNIYIHMPLLNCLNIYVIKHLLHDSKIEYVIFGTIKTTIETKHFGNFNNRNPETTKNTIQQICNKTNVIEKSDNFVFIINLNVYNDKDEKASLDNLNFKIELQQIPTNFDTVFEEFDKWNETTKESGIASYYDIHKDLIISNSLNHYNSNKELINENRKTKITCDICGGFYTINNKSVHYRTKKHLKHVTSV